MGSMGSFPPRPRYVASSLSKRPSHLLAKEKESPHFCFPQLLALSGSRVGHQGSHSVKRKRNMVRL